MTMATLTLDDAITQALAAHDEWRTRLRTIISNGGTDLDARKVRRSDECDFGKWLEGRTAKVKSSARWKEICELHTRFHDATGRVIELVDERRRAEAIASLQSEGEFGLAAADFAKGLAKFTPAA
jgi:hypothetical protein